MAKQLWLLRHGEAEPHDARADAERRLTERGEQQAASAGAALVALAVTFQAVFTSSKIRACETARIAAAALGTEFTEDASLARDFGARDALELAAAGDRILLVGHEPDFGQVIHDISGARVELKKGGVAGIRLTGGSRGELVVLLRPRELDRIAGV